MATAPMTVGQMKELASACVEAIPTDLSSETAQGWIGKKGELGDRLRAILLGAEVGNLDIDWGKAYAELGMVAEFDKAFPTLATRDDLWIVPVLQGVTCNKVVACLRKQGVNMYLYVENLDKEVRVNDRDLKRDGSYSVAFRRTVEADEENKNLSANALKAQNHKGTTLLERLLLELGYFLATGKHLDEKNWTLCSGSRYSHGGVPLVRWDADDRKVSVCWDRPDDSDDFLRSRSAVSL